MLEEQGTARRTHGGVLYAGGMPRLAEFGERQPANWAAKRAIAVRAVEEIADGETVLLDGGTTTYEVARLLVGRSLQVVTNSLPVANLFASESRTDLVLLGGYVSPRTGVCLGPYANELLGRLHVTTTVLSAAGIDAEGLFNAHLLLAETEQAMLKAAGRVIVVADSSKFGRKSLTLVSPPGRDRSGRLRRGALAGLAGPDRRSRPAADRDAGRRRRCRRSRRDARRPQEPARMSHRP